MDENVRISRSGKHCVSGHNFEEIERKVTIVYLIIMVALVIAFFVGFGIWKYNNRVQARAIETYKAEIEAQQANDSAIKMEEIQAVAAARKAEIDLFAKLFEGVRGFNPSVDDLITYGWAVYNREDSRLYPNTVEEVIHQENQWTCFSDENFVVSDYHRVAEKLVNMRYSGDPRPCTTDFLWAEIADDGIYLKNSVEPGKIARTWHYSGS